MFDGRDCTFYVSVTHWYSWLDCLTRWDFSSSYSNGSIWWWENGVRVLPDDHANETALHLDDIINHNRTLSNLWSFLSLLTGIEIYRRNNVFSIPWNKQMECFSRLHSYKLQRKNTTDRAASINEMAQRRAETRTGEIELRFTSYLLYRGWLAWKIRYWIFILGYDSDK